MILQAHNESQSVATNINTVVAPPTASSLMIFMKCQTPFPHNPTPTQIIKDIISIIKLIRDNHSFPLFRGL